MRKILLLITAIFLAFLLYDNFNKEEESITETAEKKVDEITTKAADTVVKKVRTPLNKARGTKDFGDERTEAIDRMMKEQ
jgi:hypothetical protein